MLSRNTRRLAPALLIGLIIFAASAVLAEPTFFNQRCASCHSNDTATCNGCHFHALSGLHATANADIYAPGDPVDVTLDGGSQHGWIRAILYDQNDLVLALATGPTGTGDDSQPDPVVYPVLLHANAPGAPGDYGWEAAWWGGATNGGGSHLEARTPVTIHVEGTGTGVPDAPDDTIEGQTWSSLKNLY